KHTVRNIADTREFVFNLATRKLANAMNVSGAPHADGISEFGPAGLTAATSRTVRAPRVAESPASLECRLISIQELTDIDGNRLQRFLVLGQVVGVHIDTAYLKDGLFDTAAANPIARCGYLSDYAEVSSL